MTLEDTIEAGLHTRLMATANGRHLAVATLDRPKSLNALDLDTVLALDARLRAWASDPRVVGVWLDSSSEKAFCAGGGLRSVYESLTGPQAAPAYSAKFFVAEYRLDYRVHTYRKPIVTWLHGITMGGGIGLACGAANRVVTEASQFAMPEVSIGLFPDVAGSWFLSRMPGRIGLYLALTGARMSAADAVFAGLADLPIAQARKQDTMNALLKASWDNDLAHCHTTMRRVLLSQVDWSITQQSELTQRFHTLSRLCSAASVEELVQAIFEHAPTDGWMTPHVQTLKAGSPTSVKLSWELQRCLRGASLPQTFQTEYDAVLGCCDHGEFVEGIRALLIDKDKSPRWKPATLAEVNDDIISDILRPRWTGTHPLATLD